MTFKLTDKQLEAQLLARSKAENILFEGGSRSGKTFLHVRNIVLRALKAPESRHAILRSTFKSVKTAIALDTFPKMMKLCFPHVPYHINRTDWFVMFENGSEIWFGGLDTAENVDKILGYEYATIYLNEASLITYKSLETVKTRLAQQVSQKIQGQPETELTPRMYYDCNPPSKGHWLYKTFHLYQDADKKALDKEEYVKILMNPQDNEENLAKGYMKTLKGMTARRRKRFLEGKYSDENPNQLFSDVQIEANRVMDNTLLPDMVRVVVAVDPSGSGDEENASNDAIGIVVAGLGTDGIAYVLQDCTVKAGPKTWGKVATDAYDNWKGDCVVGEANYGGAMVKFVIQTAKSNIPYHAVNATRGKAVRAEPISALYELGKVKHVGNYDLLEDELMGFSTVGYIGELSPNRADALVWAITELFPGVVNKSEKPVLNMPSHDFGW